MQTPSPQVQFIPQRKPGATILVVEDEPAVRMVVSEILQHQGYRVLACETGCEAIEIYRAQSSGIDLIILDLALPDVHGEQLLIDLRQICPNVRVVASSGYPLMQQHQSIPGQPLDGYLKKPFDALALGQAVSAALVKRP